MTGRANLHALTDSRLCADDDRSYRVAVYILAQTGIGTHCQVPGLPDAAGRQHVARPLNLGAEELQKEDPPRTEKIAARSRSKKHEPDNLPQHTAKLAGERMAVLVILKLKLIHRCEYSTKRASGGQFRAGLDYPRSQWADPIAEKR